jgi:hypothetical protein
VHNAIRQIGQRCKPNDVFFLFYSGHGTSVTDLDGDEVDGHDEAYVLCDSQTGQAIPPQGDSLMTDDELVTLLGQSLNPRVKVIVVSDCCHSGSICDFKKQIWKGRRAVSISGCRDTQTSGDTGNGGICTHSLLLAVEQMQKKGLQSYNMAALFRETVLIDDSVFHSPQDITVDTSPGFSQSEMDWPLVPKTPYTAPYTGHHPGVPANHPPAHIGVPANHPPAHIGTHLAYPLGAPPYVTAHASAPSHHYMAPPSACAYTSGPHSQHVPPGVSSYIPPTVTHMPVAMAPVVGSVFQQYASEAQSMSPYMSLSGSQLMAPYAAG